jgi:hypothetical protein
VKRPRRLAVLTALYGTVALAGGIWAGLAGLGSLKSTAQNKVIRATSAAARAERIDAPRATSEHGVSVVIIASGSAGLANPPPMPRPAVGPAPSSGPDPDRKVAGSVEVDPGTANTALSGRPPTPQLAAVSPSDTVQNAARPAVSSEAPDACPEPDVCIDQYLWSIYERTPKVDILKVRFA